MGPPLRSVLLVALVALGGVAPVAGADAAARGPAVRGDAVDPARTGAVADVATDCPDPHGEDLALEVWIAPANATLDTTEGIAAATETEPTGPDTLTNPHHKHVAIDDTLVLAIAAPGLDDRVAAADGENLTERFATAVRESPNVSLRATESESVDSSEGRKSLLTLAPTALTVVRANATDSYWLVYDTEHLDGRTPDGDDGRVDVRPGEAYCFALTVGERTATSTVLVPTRSGDFFPPESVVMPDGNATVLVDTALAPGSALPVVVRNGSGAVVARSTTRVRDDADRIDPDPGSQFVLTVPLGDAGAGDTRYVTLPTVEDEGTTPNATLRIRRTRATIESVDAAVVEDGASVTADFGVSHGGFAVVRSLEDGERLRVLGWIPNDEYEAYEGEFELDAAVEPGERVAVTLYRDTNLNFRFDPEVDEPYRRNGTVVRATATVADARDPETTEPQTTTRQTTIVTTRSSEPDTTDTTTDRYTPVRRIPGFGALAALAALSLAGLLALRRREN